MNCEICAFKNLKATVTAIIIKDNKMLLLKRNQEPFKGMWDLPGGFMQEDETPKEALIREMKEELTSDIVNITFIKVLPGKYYWKDKEIPISGHFYLTELHGDITLDEENSEYQFIALKDINPADIAFDSNQKIVEWIKENFMFDLERVRELMGQLDASSNFNEQYLYRAMLDGFVSKMYDGEKLIGMGWIFPRQTLLRRQAVVEDMIVDDAYRGKGYGQKMLLDLLDWAKKERMDMVELTTNPNRLAANELYKKVGFSLHPTNHYLYKV
jgi:ADP-ribose pyrophosphatase YjhB (NUDIX family)